MNRIARIVLQPGNFIVEGIQAPLLTKYDNLATARQGLVDRLEPTEYVDGLESIANARQNAQGLTEAIARKDARMGEVYNTISGWDKMRTPLNLAAYGLYATPFAWGISNSYNDMVNEELRQRQRAMMAQQGVYPR